jgi:hypothetical protein
VEDLDALDLRRRAQAADDLALDGLPGITRRSHHDSHAVARIPLGRLALLELSVRSRDEVRHEIGLHPAHERLALRIAEAHVVLEDARSALGEHQAEEKDAAELDAFLPHRVRGRQEHALLDLLVQAAVHDRNGREHAHPAGVRARVALAEPLVVLHRLEDQERVAVGDREHARFLARHELLDHDALARLAGRRSFHDRVDRGASRADVLADVDALARREPVGLDHERPRPAPSR